jgi:NAD-dependent dihydropyrimidine dehydrogenase PreA subunit
MDLQTCFQKLQLVGVLNFATVDGEGNPQIRNISAIHYEENVYPGNTREIGIVFKVDSGSVEYFNLGVYPIFREVYTFGGATAEEKGYIITDACMGCGTCKKVCPQQCIDEGKIYCIRPNNCLHCGNCYENCPVKAIKQL